MTWTVEDERRYQELLRRKAALEAQLSGDKQLSQADAAQRPQRSPSEDEQKAGFSITRMFGGAIQDVYNNAVDLVDYLSNPIQALSSVASRGVGTPFSTLAMGLGLARAAAPAVQRAVGVEKPVDTVPQRLDIVEESVNPWEKAGRTLTSFMVPYVGYGRALGAFRSGIGFTQSAARSLAAATATNVTVMDGTEANLANTLRDDFGMDNDVLDALATEDDDDLLEGRVKAAISNLPLDLLGEGLAEGAIRAAKAYRGIRQNNQAVKDLLDVTKSDITISREAAAKAAAENTDNTIKVDEVVSTPAETVSAPGESLATTNTSTVEIKNGEVVVARSQVKPAPITSLDEFVTEVKRVTDNIVDPKQLNKIADALINDPHEALTFMKIDPAKLDYSVFTDAASMKALQNSLGDIIDDVAKKTGRTGIVVSNKETLKAARLLAAQPWQISKLVESTKGLASRLTAARIMVGSHAHKLLAASDAAMKEIRAGGAGKAYADFVATLEAHGYLLGVLRGAGSEVGRGLQSLQMSVDVSAAYKSLTGTAEEALARAEALKAQRLANLAKGREAKAAADAMVKVDVTSDDAVTFLKEVADGRIDLTKLEAIAKNSGVTPERAAKELGLNLRDLTKAKKASEAYEGLFKDLQTDAGRLRLMQKLESVKGDLSKLSRIMKQREQTGWVRKVDNALKDTTGALFSFGTAGLNLIGAATIMSLKGITHTLAAAGLSGKALLTGNMEASLAARKQALKAWATFHAPMQAFGTAFARGWAELKGAGLEEAAFIADGLKLEKAAREMQALSIDARKGTDRLFLKEDFESTGGFSVQPETLNALARQIEEWPIGRFAQAGLEWFARTGAAAINTAGAGYRLGTSIFINAPDQFAGTFATRVGQHTAAVDIAAKEAAEAGLDGDALVSYIKGRAIELGDMIDEGVIGSDPFNDGIRDIMDKSGVDFAREVNFSDDIETGWVRSASQLAGEVPIAGTLIMPFPKTPLRVMERTILDYTPFYALKKATREAWMSGNAEVRGEIAARWTLTWVMLSAAWQLTNDDTVIGFDGGWRSTGRRERGSYSIRIGDDTYEYNRIDPTGTILGMVADVREIASEGRENRELVQMVEGDDAYVRELSADLMEAVGWAVFKNVLSKSYLESLEQLNEMSAAKSPDEFSSIASSWAASLGTRAVPMSGVQRQAVKAVDPEIRMARGFMEGVVKATFGAEGLPVRRDPIFGRPMEYKAGERLVGLKGGPTKTDPVNKELARLSFDVGAPKWKQRDVELNTQQMERFMQLRGHTVEVDGYTLEEVVTEFLNSPEYQELTDEARVEGIKTLMRPYSREALDQLIREDDDLAFKMIVAELRDDFRLNGRDMRELKPEAERFAKELGLKR